MCLLIHRQFSLLVLYIRRWDGEKWLGRNYKEVWWIIVDCNFLWSWELEKTFVWVFRLRFTDVSNFQIWVGLVLFLFPLFYTLWPFVYLFNINYSVSLVSLSVRIRSSLFGSSLRTLYEGLTPWSKVICDLLPFPAVVLLTDPRICCPSVRGGGGTSSRETSPTHIWPSGFLLTSVPTARLLFLIHTQCITYHSGTRRTEVESRVYHLSSKNGRFIIWSPEERTLCVSVLLFLIFMIQTPRGVYLLVQGQTNRITFGESVFRVG